MTESELLAHLRSNPFVLAPMAGITDSPFRSFMRRMGAGIVVSELVSATGLKYSSAKTIKLMEFEETQRPVGVQIFGENLDHLNGAARFIEQTGADFVDLNFGCPVPKVVNKGAGSACLKDLLRLRDVIRATRVGLSIPLTIKVRTGWDADSRNTHEVTKIAGDEGVSWVAIHGRTRAAAYSGRADWDYIAEVKSKSPVPIIGNGDIHTSERALSRLRESGCDGVMIGRGCLKNPWIFRDARAMWKGEGERGRRPILEALTGLRTHLENYYPERIFLIQMRKFALWYSAGYPGSSSFRKNLFQTKDKSETFFVIENYFNDVSEHLQMDTSSEPFLMGGHG